MVCSKVLHLATFLWFAHTMPCIYTMCVHWVEIKSSTYCENKVESCCELGPCIMKMLSYYVAEAIH